MAHNLVTVKALQTIDAGVDPLALPPLGICWASIGETLRDRTADGRTADATVRRTIARWYVVRSTMHASCMAYMSSSVYVLVLRYGPMEY